MKEILVSTVLAMIGSQAFADTEINCVGKTLSTEEIVSVSAVVGPDEKLDSVLITRTKVTGKTGDKAEIQSSAQCSSSFETIFSLSNPGEKFEVLRRLDCESKDLQLSVNAGDPRLFKGEYTMSIANSVESKTALCNQKK